jgi:hypothetical protein
MKVASSIRFVIVATLFAVVSSACIDDGSCPPVTLVIDAACFAALCPPAEVACVTTCLRLIGPSSRPSLFNCINVSCLPPPTAPVTASAPRKRYEYPFGSQTLSGEQATALVSDALQGLSVNAVGLPDLATTQQGLGMDLTIPATNAINTLNGAATQQGLGVGLTIPAINGINTVNAASAHEMVLTGMNPTMPSINAITTGLRNPANPAVTTNLRTNAQNINPPFPQANLANTGPAMGLGSPTVNTFGNPAASTSGIFSP